MGRTSFLIFSSSILVTGLMTGTALTQHSEDSPQTRYGALFTAVQAQKLFPDSKTFADAIATDPIETIVKAYQDQSHMDGFDLKKFVQHYFKFAEVPSASYQTGTEDVCTHIRNLWPVLTRYPVDMDTAMTTSSSLLPLRYTYVVPGGRFQEIYYWDSYFTMLGLRESGEMQMLRSMVQNFADLIGRYGHVPNGNRSYYLSRSQPPFFALMVDLLADVEGEQIYQEFLPALRAEYTFWMAGQSELTAGQSTRRVVRMPDGSVLNRYYSDEASPRDEAWREDVATAKSSGRKAADIYRDLRAAAESGWDFSSRWLKNPQDLSSIRTTDIVPVDLNALLYHLEQVLAKGYRIDQNKHEADIFTAKALRRKQAFNTYLWNEEMGFYADYIQSEQRVSKAISAATLYPLFFSLADQAAADRIALMVEKHLLQAGGLVTTPVETGQQWDAPNVWAPLQWIAVKGLGNYHQDRLALTIARQWTDNVVLTYRNTGALKEKYRADQTGLNAGGGEYPNQDGFGWTNGVMLALLKFFPQLPAGKDCRSP